MEANSSALNGFEMPVANFDRARHFCSRIFDYEMPTRMMGNGTMRFPPFEMGQGAGGAIVEGESYSPSA